MNEVDVAVIGGGPAGLSAALVLSRAGRRVPTRRLLVTTGLRDELPDVPGLRERWARDVLHCPYCHGHEVRGRRLGILGGAPGAVRYAQIVRQWSRDVVCFTPPGRLTNLERSRLVARAVGIVEEPVERLVVEGDRLCGIAVGDGRVIPRDALFVPPRFAPNSDLLADLGCELDEDGWSVRDGDGHTSIRGVWVAGNVANPRAQVVTGAGAARPRLWPSTPTSSRRMSSTPSTPSSPATSPSPQCPSTHVLVH